MDIGNRAALLVIDVQAGFADAGWGARNNPDAEARIAALLAAWRSAGRPVVHVRHDSASERGSFHPGTPGNDAKPEAEALPGESVHRKTVNSGFIGTRLEGDLRASGIDEVVIVGLTTNHCVSTTARMAANLGFRTVVVSDATATFDGTAIDGTPRPAAEIHLAALSDLSGEFADVVDTADVLDAVARTQGRNGVGRGNVDRSTGVSFDRAALAGDGVDPALRRSEQGKCEMAVHTADVSWSRGRQLFVDNRYSRRHEWRFDGGAVIAASSSPHVVRTPFSDPAAVDPEEAFIAALSSCHMLWFLGLAAQAGLTIESYDDSARSRLVKDDAGRDWLAEVILSPKLRISGDPTPSDELVADLHHRAHEACFLANSVKSKVTIEGTWECVAIA